MSEMVERVAKAIVVALGYSPDAPMATERDIRLGLAGDPFWMSYVGEARAAIAAMREPTEAMERAGSFPGAGPDDPGCQEHEAAGVWERMIDEALKP